MFSDLVFLCFAVWFFCGELCCGVVVGISGILLLCDLWVNLDLAFDLMICFCFLLAGCGNCWF